MYVNHPFMVSQMLQNSRIHIFVFNNLYLYSTRYISFQQLIFLFKTIHLHSTSTLATFIQQLIYVQLTFNFNHHYLYSTKIFIQLQPSLFLFNKSKVPGHTDKYTFNKPTRPYPRRFTNTTHHHPRPIARGLKTIFKMASSRSSEASEAVRREELSKIVRECVRSAMALQRSGNTSLLMRTSDLIANSARSANREATNSIVAPSFPATSSPLLFSSAGPSETHFHTGQSSSFQAGSKRPAASTSQHPWRFKKGRLKKTEVSFHPKAVHLLDKPAE